MGARYSHVYLAERIIAPVLDPGLRAIVASAVKARDTGTAAYSCNLTAVLL